MHGESVHLCLHVCGHGAGVGLGDDGVEDRVVGAQWPWGRPWGSDWPSLGLSSADGSGRQSRILHGNSMISYQGSVAS